MPQVHSTTSTSTDMNVSSSGKTKPEVMDALFASILAEEQTSETAEIKADLDVSNQYIDEISKLINEPIEEEYTTSPEELLQQIGHSVSFNTELNKTPAQKVNLGGEILPQVELTAESQPESTSEVLPTAILATEIQPQQPVVDVELPVEQSTLDAELSDGIITPSQIVAGTQPVQASVASSAQTQTNPLQVNAQLNSSIAKAAELKAKPMATETVIDEASIIDDVKGIDPELSKPELVKPALNIEPTQPKKDNKIMPVPQKGVEEQVAANVEVSDSEINPLDDIQDMADGMESIDKPTTKSSLQLGQTAPVFANNERVEARGEVPRFNVSLKQGLEQQVQMQDMIQRFAPVMKQQVMAMVSNGIGQAEIRLDPPELGHMMVRIQVQHDQTQVQFQVANPTAREMLEQATPRLRDMLAEQGMNLADSQVSYHDGSRDQQGSNNGDGHSGSAGGGYSDAVSDAEEVTLTNIAADQPSGIDYYA